MKRTYNNLMLILQMVLFTPIVLAMAILKCIALLLLFIFGKLISKEYGKSVELLWSFTKAFGRYGSKVADWIMD